MTPKRPHTSIVLLFCVVLCVAGADAGAPPLETASVVKLTNQSRIAMAEGRLDAGRELAEAALAVDPSYSEAWKQYGRVAMISGEASKALDSFENAWNLRPGDSDILLWMIEIIPGADDATANRISGFLGEREVGSAYRLAMEATRRMRAGDLSGAGKVLGSAGGDVHEGGKIPLAAAWLRLGSIRNERREYGGAVSSLEEALRLRPGWVPALRELGWAFRGAGQAARAAETWERGLSGSPKDEQWLLWITEARLAVNELQQAEAAVDRLLAETPAHPKGCALKVMFLALRKSPDLSAYEATLAGQTDGPRVIALGHAMAERRLGRFPAAAARLEGLSGVDSTDPDVRSVLAEIYSAWASSADPAERIVPLRRLVALQPEHRSAWRDLGWSLWTTGKHDDAIAAWERFINPADTEQARVRMQLAAVIAESDESRLAVDLYRKWNPGAPLLPVGVELVSSGRLTAAAPFIEAASEAGEDPSVAALYMARIASYNGLCGKSAGLLDGFVQNGIRKASESEVQVFLASIEACSDDPDMLPLIQETKDLYPASTPAGRKVTEILAGAGFRQASLYGGASAMEFYLAALDRDPDYPGLWRRAYQALQSSRQGEEADALLRDVAMRCRSAEVRESVAAVEAMDRHDPQAALDHVEKSLFLDPEQAELHMDRFRALMALGRFAQAGTEEEWFSQRIRGGDYSLQNMLADIETALGKDAEALDLWRRLQLASPQTVLYALESAGALLRLCRADEAIQTLEEFVAVQPDSQVYRLLAETEAELGRPERVLFWTRKGLAFQQDRELLELEVQAGDVLGNAEVVREGVKGLGGPDVLDGSLSRIVGDAIRDPDEAASARAYQEGLLNRNPEYLPSLSRLEELAALAGDTAGSLRFAERIGQLRPWDLTARRLRAVKAVENHKTRQGLEGLRKITRLDPNRAVPILIYSNVSVCPYPKRNTVSQVTEHLELLAKEGYRFIFPSEITDETDSKRVIVAVVDSRPAAIREIDSVLRRIGGRALFFARVDALTRGIIDETGGNLLDTLRDNPRWLVASKGGLDSASPDGVSTNPFTHRLLEDGRKEGRDAYADRVDRLLAEASRPLTSNSSVFLYAEGDYGQLSLDTDRETLDTLRDRVRMRFDYAIAYDATGFAGPQCDPLRLPGRIVPAGWAGDDLRAYLTRRNPLVEARLDLAKALSWNGQHDRANEWFRLAEAAGADPADLELARGSNALFQSDLPAALDHLRKAHELNPESERATALLQKAEIQRRPGIESEFEMLRDSDHRETLRFGGAVSAFLTDRLKVEAFYDHNRWSREGFGSMEGERYGAGLLWAFAERKSAWVRLWNMDIGGGDDFIGFDGGLHMPNLLYSGDLDLQLGRKQVDTVEAVKKGIREDHVTLSGSTRFFDLWDFAMTVGYVNRTDDNSTISLQGSVVRRLREAPFIGLGYAFQFADSDRKSDLYWTPRDLWQHQAYVTSQWRIFDWLSYDVGVKAGVSRELGHDSSFVWNAKANLTATPVDRIELNLGATHMESSSYKESSIMLSIGAKF